MAKADQLKALISSHASGDDSRFYAVALQVAAQAARSGHSNMAKELRDLVDQAKLRTAKLRAANAPDLVPMTQPRGELAGLLTVAYPKTRLAEMALSPELKQRIERVIREQRRRAHLRSHGFQPQRKLLLIGPPGTGKTMTASMLAGELGLPMFTIQLHGLITRFLGETAAKLRVVFDAIAQTRGVYLFDEFDALGSQRGSGNDVGEIRRVLNSFLQFIEQDISDSLLLGATNHVGMLDDALFRRFDTVFEYALPSTHVATAVMQDRLALLDTNAVDWAVAATACAGLSHAELTRACEQAAKNVLLDDHMSIDTTGLVSALSERVEMRR